MSIINLLVGVILWLGWTFSSLSTSLVLLNYSLFSSLRRIWYCPTLVCFSNYFCVFIMMYLDSNLTQVICPTTLLSRFSFFVTYLDASLTLSSLKLFYYILLWVQIDTPKDSIIVRYSESDHPPFNWLSPL